jgi:chaperonin GroEL (HSP60 family)
MLNGPGGDTVPLLIVSDIHQEDLLEDIAHMCGAPLIKKYLNPDIQKEDIDKGLAPTGETVCDFCGSADLIVSDLYKTKFINPAMMFNEDGSYSDEYKSVLSFLENELKKAQEAGEGINTTGRLKRRINSFKGNMIDLLIGGVSNSDRNNLKASVEDAVLNCRSAAKYGVGYGANYMALEAFKKLYTERTGDLIAMILYNAYEDLSNTLYASAVYGDKEEAKDITAQSLKEGCPFNIRTNEYDNNVLSSIRSDVVILDTVSKILTLMFTCNQYLVPTPAHNIYLSEEEEDK